MATTSAYIGGGGAGGLLARQLQSMSMSMSMSSAAAAGNMSAACGDDSFGPQVRLSSCRSGFDFTLLFEESILTLGPAALFLLAVPVRVFQLHRCNIKVSASSLHTLKLVTIGVYALLQLALLILWSLPSSTASTALERTRASTATASINLAVALCFFLISHYEHSRSIRPSFLLNLYLLLSLLFDSARVRTQWLIHNSANGAGGAAGLAVPVVFTVAVAVKLGLLVLEAVEKRGLLLEAYGRCSPEATSGLLSRSGFWWLNPLLVEGFGKVLSLEDLFPVSEELASQAVAQKVRKTWGRSKKKGKNALILAVAWSFRGMFLPTVLPRLGVLALLLSQPFIVERAITFAAEPINAHTTNVGYGLIGAYGVVYIGLAVMTGWYQHLTYRVVTMMRGALVALVYDKMLTLRAGSVNESAAMTLMSTDVERIGETAEFVFEMWAYVLQIGIAIWLLEARVGVACVAPVVVVAGFTLVSMQLARFITPRQKAWLEAIQTRVNATSEILGSMKGVKMTGLTEKVASIIQGLRVRELDLSVKYRHLSVINSGMTNLPGKITPVITFAAFALIARAKGDASLDVSQAFASLSIVALLSDPIGMFIYSVPALLGTLGCFQRIQEYLLQEPRVDYRILVSERPQNRMSEGISGRSSKGKKESEGVELQVQMQGKDTGKAQKLSREDYFFVENGSFGWADVEEEDKKKDKDGEEASAPTSTTVLHDIVIRIPRGKLTMIVGPVGSGKSTLLHALLGETVCLGGHVYTAELEAAFCPQESWIFNGTLRENVLSVLPFDEAWYSTVIRACALEQDLQVLPDGDQTLVGSKGITLSGGQKQRVAIARALYARKSLAIFDDVLSGLDAVTEEHVFSRVFSRDGLLVRSNTTVILVSHRLRNLSAAEHVVALAAGGRIQQQGSFAQLMAEEGGYVHGLELQARDGKPETVDEGPAVVYNKDEAGKADTGTGKGTGKGTDDPARMTGDMSVLVYYLRSMGFFRLVIFASFLVGEGVFGGLQFLWLNWWSSANASDPGSRLGYWLGIYALFAILSSLSLVCAIISFLIVIVPKSSNNLHSVVLKAAMAAPMAFFATTDTGVIINRFGQDMRLADMTLPSAVINAAFQFVTSIMMAILTSVATKWIAVALPFIAATLYLVQKFYLRTSRQLRLMDIETKAPLYSHFIESLNGVTTLRASGPQQTSASQAHNLALLDESQKPYYLLLCVQRWLTFVLDMIVAAVAILLMGFSVRLRGSISPGYLGIAMVNVMDLSNTLTNLVKFWTLLETSLGAIARVKNFAADTAPEEEVGEREEPARNWPAAGAIEFMDVSAAYDSTAEPVLKNVSLSTKPGERIGICGRTGSGKSSLILTLFRMLELTSGTITIDSIDITTLPRASIRHRLVALSQEALLLPGTVRLNADPFGVADDDAIYAALEKVQLADVVRNKGGLDVDMDAGMLSHGQRQLFCLARALLRRTAVLVLDEPTSSVDAKTDEMMQRVIREEFEGCTVLMIAHKLQSVLDFDRIAVLDKGRLVEFDSPDALLARPDSAFRALYDA